LPLFPGHNAPVTLLKLDPLGKVLLSGDSEGRDRSIRLWDLSSGSLKNVFVSELAFKSVLFPTGKSLSVYTPSKQITACELTSNGKFITLALKNKSKLVTLQLCDGSGDNAIESNDDSAIYGEMDNEGKVFNLND
jgi:WD40 repeat protein